MTVEPAGTPLDCSKPNPAAKPKTADVRIRTAGAIAPDESGRTDPRSRWELGEVR